jgi:hypothetical protein
MFARVMLTRSYAGVIYPAANCHTAAFRAHDGLVNFLAASRSRKFESSPKRANSHCNSTSDPSERRLIGGFLEKNPDTVKHHFTVL